MQADLSALFEQIMTASPWPVLLLDETDAVLAASDEAGDQRAGSDDDVTLRARAAHYLSLFNAGVPQLALQAVDSVRERPDGALVHERVHLRRMPWGACVTVVDQTELRRLQGAEAQTARLAALGFMVAGVCHEVTNPLTSLHSIVQILRAEPDPSPALLTKGLANIATNVKRILDISRRLVTFSRVGEEPHARFRLDDALDEALNVLAVDHLLREIELSHRRDPEAVVSGRIGQVREVFVNLLVNAIQAMRGRGSLTLTTRAGARTASVAIADSGPGVPGEVAGRIFEPFFTTKGGAQGTGLGLAISMEIALEHGGTIALERSSSDGATFTVTLPRETA